MGSVPDMDVVELRRSDGKVLSSTHVLDMDAFGRAYDEHGDEEGRRVAYEALKARTIQVVEQLDKRLAGEGWQTLEACTVDLPPWDTDPRCAMTEQQIQCGDAVRLVYREPRVDVSAGKRKLGLTKRGWIPPPEKNPNSDGMIRARGCISSAFLAPSHNVVVTHVAHECHGATGDWCHLKGTWGVVDIPSIPKTAEKPKPDGTCPKDMIAIPGGSFEMGSAAGDEGERPPHTVKVADFCIDTREVTVADYRACLKAGRCFSPNYERYKGPGAWGDRPSPPECNGGVRGNGQHPMNCVPATFAEEYCASAGKRLPTEQEWEMAARGPDKRRYPTGDAVPGGVCFNKTPAATCPAGTSPGDRSPFGVLDMMGNVREWTATPYERYDGCAEGAGLAVRGGSFSTLVVDDLRATKRFDEWTKTREANLGFRCAKGR